MSEKQSCAADIVYKQIDGGWHQYTVSLRPGQNYSHSSCRPFTDSECSAHDSSGQSKGADGRI